MTSAPVRKIVEQPRDKEGLFIQPKETGADRELAENHNRLNFANNFSFADQWTGNTRTYDPSGNYRCGECNKADASKCLLIAIAISRQAGSCRHWENLCAGDPELRMPGVESAELAAYGEARNGQGFGCHRCPYSEKAYAADSRGRDHYCKKGDFRINGTSCCQLNGAEVVTEYEDDKPKASSARASAARGFRPKTPTMPPPEVTHS